MSKMRTPMHPLLAHAVLDALRAAVQPAAGVLRRHEEQVSVDRHVALLGEADVMIGEHGLERVGDVPDLEAAEVALVDVVAAEREVGVRVASGRRDRWDETRPAC